MRACCVASACARVGRDSAAVDLIVVSKTFPVDAIGMAIYVGQRHFGESRLQEAEPKIESLPVPCTGILSAERVALGVRHIVCGGP
jgi:uncharacterized pyridoxal phosphate-containing UPF0001 family protein